MWKVGRLGAEKEEGGPDLYSRGENGPQRKTGGEK